MAEIGFPGEIWIEILSRLSSSDLFKTCVLNSALLELSLDFLYEDVRLSSADSDIEKTFKHLM